MQPQKLYILEIKDIETAGLLDCTNADLSLWCSQRIIAGFWYEVAPLLFMNEYGYH